MKNLKLTKNIQIILITLLLFIVCVIIVASISNNGTSATQMEICATCTTRRDGIC